MNILAFRIMKVAAPRPSLAGDAVRPTAVPLVAFAAGTTLRLFPVSVAPAAVAEWRNRHTLPRGNAQPRRQARSPQVGHRRPGITGRRRFGSIYQLGPSQSKIHPPTVRHTGISPLTQLPHYRAGNRLKIRDPSIFQSLLRWSRSHLFNVRMISVGTPSASPSSRIRG